ncbi:MAG: tRNA(His) guanylyltransferase Thg1 family protein [Candidatus Aenigmarchaeota archaeon]|nr:tRNA(His) guanylyltransferase Thg1 family protein [Candidatus Aenigmarchaeota archaeon]
MRKPWQIYNLPRPKSEASKGPLSLVYYEIYSGIVVPKKAFVVRFDGWSFHSLTKKLKFKEPFDKLFVNTLAKTTQQLFRFFNPDLGYIFSDEINLLFLKQTSFRRIEKIDSVFAALASSVFYSSLKKKFKEVPPVAFDCRVIPIGTKNIFKYFAWRQAEAFRNFNNAYARYALMKGGMTARGAAKKLAGVKTKELRKLIEQSGIDLKKLPPWQERGILIYWKYFKKIGYNPIKKRQVVTTRRKPIINWKPPNFNSLEGKKFFKMLIK